MRSIESAERPLLELHRLTERVRLKVVSRAEAGHAQVAVSAQEEAVGGAQTSVAGLRHCSDLFPSRLLPDFYRLWQPVAHL